MDTLKNKKDNLAKMREIVERSAGVKRVLVVTNGGDGAIVEEELGILKTDIFRKDGDVAVMAHEEKTRRGQFFGMLDAIRHFEKEKGLDRNDVTLGLMMPGKGTRMSPFTQRAHGIKPLLPMLIRVSGDGPWLSGATASLYTWNLVAYCLREMGFRGVAWKWGDEPQIASKSMTALITSGMDLSNADIICFSSDVVVTDDLTENKDWLSAAEDGTFLAHVKRRKRDALLERLGIENVPGARARVHIGSPAFSYLFVERAMEVFRDYLEDSDKRAKWADVNGYLIEALTQDQDAWNREYDEERESLKSRKSGMRELLRNCPDFYRMCQLLKEKIREAKIEKGIPEKEAALEIKVIDFGKDIYWGDIGQLAKARTSLYQVNENNPEGIFARELAALHGAGRDRFGNLVSGDCLYPRDGSVRNSVLIDARISGGADIDGAVIVNSRIGDARIGKGSVVFFSTAMHLAMGERAFSFKSVSEDLEIPPDGAHTSMPEDLKDVTRGLEDWRADGTRDVGSDENYKVPRFGNPRSFAEQQAKMRQREVSPRDIESRLNSHFRALLEEKLNRVKEISERHRSLRFGTSGLRALVTEMTDMECYINARGFIDFLRERGEIDASRNAIALGGDLRSSTSRIMAAVGKAIEDSGCRTFFCGRVPSPTLAFFAMSEGMPSIMVTGSHIPDDRNGIKFTRTSGEVLKTDEKGILWNVAGVRSREYSRPPEESLFDEAGMFRESHALPGAEFEEEAIDLYVRRYLEAFPHGPLAGRKIVFYQHSAVGRDVFRRIFEGLGAEVVPEARSDKFVPVDTEKVSDETRSLLRRAAKEHAPFAVISTDGDSDRPLLADENGEFLPGDKLGALASMFLKPDFAAVPISANDAVVSVLQADGVKVRQTRIGSPYVIAAMNDELDRDPGTRAVSWESNGGFLLGGDWTVNGRTLKALPTRDAVLPLVATLMLAGQEGKSVSGLIAAKLPARYTHADVVDDKMEGCESYTVEMGKAIVRMFSPADSGITQVDFTKTAVKVRYSDDRVEEAGPDLNVELTSIRDRLGRYFSRKRGFDGIVSLNFIDGIRIVFASGDVSHIRPSGNAPEFRNYATADTQERAEEIVEKRKEIVPEIVADMTAPSEPKSLGAHVPGESPGDDTPLGRVVLAVRKGAPVYIRPYEELKVWGVGGIGEYWYGAEAGEKSSIATCGDDTALMADIMACAAGDVLGADVVKNFGHRLPLVKILTPKGRLSVQFHDAKNELWIVTGIDRSVAGEEAGIILGFSREAVTRYKDEVAERYGQALREYGKALNGLIDVLESSQAGLRALEEAKNALVAAETIGEEVPGTPDALAALRAAQERLEWFYACRPVKVGDVIPVPSGTLHALGPGVEIIEPQIAGPTQSLEDGATYPVRYFFPGYPREGARKKLDLDRAGEMGTDVVKESKPEIIEESASVKIERLPGDFEDKGLAVSRITLEKGAELQEAPITSFHTLSAVKGEARAVIGGKSYDIPKAAPGGEMLLIPASAGRYSIVADEATQIIDTFTPV